MNKKLHTWALEQFKACVDREDSLRKKQMVERRFAALDQWPADIRSARENDPNGARPCLTIDKTAQYRQQIVNEIRKNRPAVKVRPVDSAADPETAKVFQKKVRHIEDRSKGHIAYQGASEWAIDVGEGYFRFITEYIEGGKQEIVIKPVPNRFSVYMGPNLMPDGSDAKYCFITEDVPVSEFRKQYPKAKHKSEDLEADGDHKVLWDSTDHVRVAECFYLESVLPGKDEVDAPKEGEPKDPEAAPDGMVATQPNGLVKWIKMTGVEIIDERDFPCKMIPVVKVVGHERIVDGKVDRWGLMRPVMDPQRQYNYWASVLVENLGLTARSKWLMAEGQDEGHELMWAAAATSTDPRLIYKPTDVAGQPVPAPVRIPAGSPDVAVLRQLPLLEHDIQTALGMFKASVGDSSSDQSGRAIKSLQAQSDTATFNFPDNVADSIAHGGRIMIDMIPRVYDTADILRLTGEDGKPEQARIDPQQPQAHAKYPQRDGSTLSIFNLGVGTYDVTATVGPSYATKRMEASEFGTELIESHPELMKVIGHIVLRNLDIDGADEMADMLERMLPPQLQKPKDGQPPLPPQVIAQITQMQQQMQMMKEELDKEKAGTQEAMAKIQVSAQSDQQRNQVAAHTAQEQLRIQEFTQTESARLAREKAEADFALKKWVAEQEVALDQAKAEAENARVTSKHNLDQAVKAHEIESTQQAEMNQMEPKIAEMFDALMKRIEGGKLSGFKPIKDKGGLVIGGSATYANGDTRDISLQ